jgi:hypothetical protein
MQCNMLVASWTVAGRSSGRSVSILHWRQALMSSHRPLSGQLDSAFWVCIHSNIGVHEIYLQSQRQSQAIELRSSWAHCAGVCIASIIRSSQANRTAATRHLPLMFRGTEQRKYHPYAFSSQCVYTSTETDYYSFFPSYQYSSKSSAAHLHSRSIQNEYARIVPGRCTGSIEHHAVLSTSQ